LISLFGGIMSNASYYQQIRKRSDELWKAIFAHPFVKGIGDGSLSRKRYEFYLKQDYVYLMDFSRVFALASAKAWILQDMRYFATLLNATLDMEMELHRKTCASFGISAAQLEKTEKSLITSAYTNLLVRTCYEGNLADILAVLLPCATGYIEIGKQLHAAGLPENKFYADWIMTYSSQEFEDLTNWLIERMNQFALAAPQNRKEYWYNLYIASARFEYLFFDMSWHMQLWPKEILNI
jgi:thiaminase/transcriptional activator TenA